MLYRNFGNCGLWVCMNSKRNPLDNSSLKKRRSYQKVDKLFVMLREMSNFHNQWMKDMLEVQL